MTEPNIMQTVVALVTAQYNGQVEAVAPIIEDYGGDDAETAIERLFLLSVALVGLIGGQLLHEEQAHGHNVADWLADLGKRFAQ